MNATELEQRKEEQLKMYGIDTIKSVAQRIGKDVALGTGKTQWVMDQLLSALVLGCPYCQGRIYLDNPVLDHKDPIGSVIRRQAADSALRKQFDNKDNLHIICTPCNEIKGDFTHNEYLALRSFLAGKDQLEAKLRRRLLQARTFWKYNRINNKAKGFKGFPRGSKFTGF